MKKKAANPLPASTDTAVITQPGWKEQLIGRFGLIAFVLALLLYAPSFTYQFTYDDALVITDNRLVKKGFQGIGEILTHGSVYGFNNSNDGAYRPLPLTVNAVLWQWFPDQPAAWHLLNILLYASIAWMLFMFLKKLAPEGNTYWAITAVLLFIVHPVHTEVVANSKSLDELLSVTFLLLAGTLLTGWRNKIPWPKALTALLIFLMALLSKETAITFVFIFPLLFYCLENNTAIQATQKAGLLLIPALLYLFIRYSLLSHFVSGKPPDLLDSSLQAAAGMAEKTATAISIIARYFKLLFIPWPLSYDYSFNQIPLIGWTEPQAWLTAVLLLVGTAGAIIQLRKRSFWAMAWLFFIAAISIVSNLVVDIAATMAERFLFVPSIAWCLFIAYLINGMMLKKDRAKKFSSLLHITGIGIVLVFGLLTVLRTPVWQSNATLVESGITSAPNSARTNNMYGSELLRKAMENPDPGARISQIQEALVYLEKAVAIYPGYVDATENAGHAYFEMGEYRKALYYLIMGLAKQRSHYKSLFFAGVCYEKLNLIDSATLLNNLALRADPASKDAHLQKIWLQLKETETVSPSVNQQQTLNNIIKGADSLLRAYPREGDLWYYKGLALMRLNDMPKAGESFYKAVEVAPNRADIFEMLGTVLGIQGKYEESISALEKCIAMSPQTLEAYHNIITSYLRVNNKAKAKEYLQRGLQLAPQDPVLIQLSQYSGLR